MTELEHTTMLYRQQRCTTSENSHKKW